MSGELVAKHLAARLLINLIRRFFVKNPSTALGIGVLYALRPALSSSPYACHCHGGHSTTNAAASEQRNLPGPLVQASLMLPRGASPGTRPAGGRAQSKKWGCLYLMGEKHGYKLLPFILQVNCAEMHFLRLLLRRSFKTQPSDAYGNDQLHNASFPR